MSDLQTSLSDISTLPNPYCLIVIRSEVQTRGFIEDMQYSPIGDQFEPLQKFRIREKTDTFSIGVCDADSGAT